VVTPEYLGSAFADIERALAANKPGVVLSAEQARQVLEVATAITEAKNELVRENNALREADKLLRQDLGVSERDVERAEETLLREQQENELLRGALWEIQMALLHTTDEKGAAAAETADDILKSTETPAP
jgi:hypothetical protein